MNSTVDISIVIPILNEQDSVDELCDRIKNVIQSLKLTYEVIFIDDLSTDNTIEKLQYINKQNENIKTIQLSRRFGYQNSIWAGLEHSIGNMVITLDSDLQHPPEIIKKMVDKFQEGYDVINMVRQNKDQKSFVSKIGSKLFYKSINIFSPTPIVVNSADFRLYSRKVVNTLLKFPEKSLFLRGLVGWVGFKQVDLSYIEEKRKFDKTKFSFWRSVRLAADGIISFSTTPLYFAIFIGGFFMVLGFLYGIWIFINVFINVKYSIAGWPTVVCLILLIGGVIMFLLGIIGLYISKLFIEVKGRPLYIVDRKIGFE